jgi:hypothetical protein
MKPFEYEGAMRQTKQENLSSDDTERFSSSGVKGNNLKLGRGRQNSSEILLATNAEIEGHLFVQTAAR